MRRAFTLVEVLVALIVALISVAIVIQALRMYSDNRATYSIYENAYLNMNTMYEIAKMVIEKGDDQAILDFATSMGIDVRKDGRYKGCDIFEISMDASEIVSMVGRTALKLNPDILKFTVLHCR